MPSFSFIDASVLCCAVVVHFFYRYKAKARPPYPPGPKPLPLIGNALDIPTVKGFEVFAEWSKQYRESSFRQLHDPGLTDSEGSDILHLGALGKHIVVLNSIEAANDLCGERSVTYSSRPHLTMLGELCVYTNPIPR